MSDRAIRAWAVGFGTIAAIAACGIDATGRLEPSPLDAGTGGEDDGATIPIDAPIAEDSVAPPPDGAPVDAGPDVVEIGPAFCQEATLTACYRFEDSIVDESAPPIGAPIMSTNVTFAPGRPGHGKALRVQLDTVLHLPDDPSWDVTNVTVEFWVNITSLPATRGGVFDNSRAYAVFIQPNGAARCGTANLDSTALPLMTWTHVACVWDATSTTVTVYVNGVQTGSLVAAANMPVAAAEPAAIGSNLPSGEQLDGLIDGLRVFNVVRTPAQIAASAQ